MNFFGLFIRNSLKNYDGEDVLITCVTTFREVLQLIKAAYAQIAFWQCTIHQLRNYMKFDDI